MNRIESFIYGIVRRNPAIKNAVRNLYQSLFDLLPRKKEYFRYGFEFKEGYYFGFHDLQELSADGLKLLVHKLPFDLRMPVAGETEQVGYLDFSQDGHLGDFHELDSTSAWNFHKGCRLQWLDDNNVIFNTAVDGRLLSKIIDVTSGESRIINSPIDSVSHDSAWATSFSYERLEKCMSGYGYPYKDDSYLDQDVPCDTGLFLVDLKGDTKKLVVSLSELAEDAPEEFRQGYMHYVTHTEFSPDDRYISFLHRWRLRTGTDLKRWTRIMVYDRTDGRLTELPSQISGSHYVWNSRNQLLASCIIDGRSCHVLFDMNNIDSYRIIAPSVLNSDGHQSFISDNLFITDTYPDKYRMAKLFRVNVNDGNTELIASVHSPKTFQSSPRKGHIACDLHPRVSQDGRYVFFDSCRTGKRGVYVMKLF
jgi:hypothetical protein